MPPMSFGTRLFRCAMAAFVILVSAFVAVLYDSGSTNASNTCTKESNSPMVRATERLWRPQWNVHWHHLSHSSNAEVCSLTVDAVHITVLVIQPSELHILHIERLRQPLEVRLVQ
eukprot:6281342-Amphidinium_carterae.1